MELGELIQAPLGGLERYRPHLRYLLIDEGRLAEEELPPDPNLAAALVRLERAEAPPELSRIVRALADWLHAPEQAWIRRGFTAWLRRVLLPQRLPEVALPELNDLEEVSAMLAERVVEWTRQWKEEGLKEGRLEGRQQGLQEGR